MSSQVSCVVNPALTILLQSAFDDLVRQIGFSWGILVTRVYSSPFLVGALFADPTYDVRGQSDTILKGLSGSPLLATEAKRATDFPVSKLWHHGSRGIQTLCPQILLGVRQYLTRRNASNDNANQDDELYSRHMVAHSYTLQAMSSVIMQVITICVLAGGEDDMISSLMLVAVQTTTLKSIQASSTGAFTFEKEQGRKRKRKTTLRRRNRLALVLLERQFPNTFQDIEMMGNLYTPRYAQ
ncbi:hypothetical protein MIR68_010483 [Amoeboaphelidium protococcarum]|nr:hypothetical protein MIR68_010483 [Amoeboaphelidium protococcarum]